MADAVTAELKEAASAFLSTQAANLSALWAWLCARFVVFLKAHGVKTTKSLSFLTLLFVPGPWMLTWAWTQPEYNVAKKMVMRLPAALGSDALPSFISNPLELQLALMIAILGVFSVVELVGLVLTQLFCGSAAATGKGYSLGGLLYLSLLQGACQFVLFCTDASQKDFSAKYFTVSTVRLGAAPLRSARARTPRPLTHGGPAPPLVPTLSRCTIPAPQSLRTFSLTHSLSLSLLHFALRSTFPTPSLPQCTWGWCCCAQRPSCATLSGGRWWVLASSPATAPSCSSSTALSCPCWCLGTLWLPWWAPSSKVGE